MEYYPQLTGFEKGRLAELEMGNDMSQSSCSMATDSSWESVGLLGMAVLHVGSAPAL